MAQNYKILIVDDQRDNLVRIVEMIEKKFKDWEIFHAVDGISAIKISIKEKPDLIILDWEMPGLDGIETTRKLKENNLTIDIPVIICTGKMTTSKHLETALSAGAVDFIRKPLDTVELLARVQSMILLSESYKNIKKLNDYKNDLLSIIAHDLKNPIYTVKLLMDLVMQKELETAKKNEILNGVRSSIASAFSLLENLLAWANSQRNKIIYIPEKLILNEIVSENLNLLQLDAETKSIDLKSNVSLDLVVFADKNMISTVIRNLLSNAIKFTANNGKVEIVATEAIDNIEITISDNGVGIGVEQLKKILDDDINITTLGTNNEIGSGIGLQLCKTFIRKNNGDFSIQSTPNIGTTFKFWLPK